MDFFSVRVVILLHQRKTRRVKIPIWIHLSSQILSNQFSLGNAEPGRHSKIVVMIDQVSAAKNAN